MKKLLVTSALVVVGFASTASAQSVLERVLTKIDNSTNLASVNGTFANIAENIGGAAAVTVYVDDFGNVISQTEYEAGMNEYVASYLEEQTAYFLSDYDLAAVPTQPNPADYNLTTTAGQAAYNTALSNWNAYNAMIVDETAWARQYYANDYDSQVVAVQGLAGIDGSILNVVDGISVATQTALMDSVSAVEYNMPTLSWGDMSTTVLGAVNTGTITLGVNQSVEQAKTTSTGALKSTIDQIGGSADTGALVLNVASNMTGINGSITNRMTEVNGTVGDLGTTVLGAVNTGTITSGVNAAVTGIVGGGTSQTGGIAN